MRYSINILLLIFTLSCFGQKTEIESLVNQIAYQEIPENFKFYYLVQKSLPQPEVLDSISLYRKTTLLRQDLNFPLEFINEKNNENVDWEKYDLKKVKYVINEYNYQTTSPPTSKKVKFVKYNIDQEEFDSLIDSKKPHTLIVKKKWLWNKKRIWKNKKFYNELVKAWKLDKKQNREEKIYFQFSKPIFSKDKQYAKVSIFKSRRCNGNGFTAIYKNNNGIWKKLTEYNQVASETTSTHVRCGDIAVTYEN